MDVLLASLGFVNLGCFLVFMLNILKNYTPEWMHDFFEWGKTKRVLNCSGWTQAFHVPNRWFSHFYVVGSSLSCAFLWMLILHCFYGNISIIKDISQALRLCFIPRIDCFTVLVSLLLLLVQTCRRLYECLFISVFSGRIHISHYLVGVAFYILDTTALAVPLLKAEKIDKVYDEYKTKENKHWTKDKTEPHVKHKNSQDFKSLQSSECDVNSKTRPEQTTKDSAKYAKKLLSPDNTKTSQQQSAML